MSENLACDVLLVFVNNNEKDAVYHAFAEKHKRKIVVKFGEVLTYHDFGLIGGAKVLGLQSEMGSTTPGGSADAIFDAINEKNPRYVILVGIAFGMNRKKQRIGDILVSQKLIQYEAEKISIDENGDEIGTPRGDIASMPARILNKFRALSDPPHWKGAPVHFGLMLSGDKLIDNAKFKAKLKKFYPEAIGGDMEAAGAYVAARRYKRDWIVVKAVCDYADGNKKRNKQKNQEIAAKNAAQLVFHVLEKGDFGSFSITGKKDKGKEKKSSPGTAIKKLVKDKISNLLENEKMEVFRDALTCVLNKERQESKKYGIDRIAAILVDIDVLEAILFLDLAFKESIEMIDKKGGNFDLKKFTWDHIVNILGWLVLLAVDDKWAKNTSQRLAEKGENLDMVLPVDTEAGAEIAFSRLKEVNANLFIDQAREEVMGEKKIKCDDWNIEVGWNKEDKIFTIKKMLWKQLSRTDPPAGGNLSEEEYITRFLRQIFKSREKRGEPLFIAVSLSSEDNPLLETGVCKYLIDDLGLNIFLIGSIDHRVAIIVEPELNAQLVEFFRNKPDKEGK